MNLELDTAPPAVRPPKLRRALIGGALLLLVDGLMLEQGMLAFLVAVSVLLVGLPRSFLSKRLAPVRRERLRNAGVHLAAVALTIGVIVGNNRIAQARAETLVAAVQAWHAKHQRYPDSLEDLVPAFIDGVPCAKFSFGANRFHYRRAGDGAFLYYVSVPPFGRPTYDFTRGEWSFID